MEGLNNTTMYNTHALKRAMGILETNLDQFLFIIMGLCLLFMQSGFAILEAGSVRSKNVTNILFKNVCDSFISGVSYWLFGFAFAYGDGNQFIGHTYFAITDLPTDRYGYFFFQFTFTATAATIVSGAMAERCEFMAYFIFSLIMTGFIYPLVTHWTWWHYGFLVQGIDYGGEIGRVGYRDFSGSGVVHTVGGMAAFVGAAILGPRIGRFDPVTGAAVHIRGHSIPLSTLGGFILFFGFLTFNGASEMSLCKAGDGEAISLAIVNTMITATFASFTATFVCRIPRFGSGAWCITVASNGAITGMVASCAGCNVLYPWGSCVLGITSGTYHVWCWIVRSVYVDDPSDAVAMHLGGGTLGVIAVGLLDRDKGVICKWNRHSGLFLGWQLLGMVVIMCWTAFWSAISFGIMRWMKILRVPKDIELKVMQSGFALLEAGSVRSKNVTNILIKNVCDSFICGVSYWLFGFAFAYGDGNQFIGHTYFAITDLPADRYGYFFFQFTFTATAATIVSGAMAERCEFMAYFSFSLIMTGFIYPLVTHWTWWHNGFLVQGIDYGGEIGRVGYRDFSGSGVVHTVGGMAAFVGAAILGPRIGRFDPVTGAAVFIRGHSIPLSTLGGFILFFGFLTFNGASQMSLSKAGDGEAISLAIVNTMITATFASFTATFVYRIPRFGSGAWCITVASNGAITGMVASCAGCNILYPWGSCVLGITAGITYHVWCWIVRTVHVDDPTDAVAMNLGGGTLGVIAVGLLDRYKGVICKWNRHSLLFLGWQLAGMVVIMCWTAFWSAISFGIMRWMKILRVPEDIELKGLDIPRHKEPGYPVESYGHGHVEKIIQILESTPMEIFQGYSNMAMTSQELNDMGPYEHPEIAAERRRSSIAMHDIHLNTVLRRNSMSIQQLHQKGSYEHPEWRPPFSHQLNHTITEVEENGSIDSSDSPKTRTKQESTGYENVVSQENQAIKGNTTFNSHALYTIGENGSHEFQQDVETNKHAGSVTGISPATITRF